MPEAALAGAAAVGAADGTLAWPKQLGATSKASVQTAAPCKPRTARCGAALRQAANAA